MASPSEIADEGAGGTARASSSAFRRACSARYASVVMRLRGVVGGSFRQLPLEGASLERRVDRERLPCPLPQSRHRRVIDPQLGELPHDRLIEEFRATCHDLPVVAARVVPVPAVLPTLLVGVGLGAHGSSAGTPKDLGQQVSSSRVEAPRRLQAPAPDLLDAVPQLVAHRRVVAPRGGHPGLPRAAALAHRPAVVEAVGEDAPDVLHLQAMALAELCVRHAALRVLLEQLHHQLHRDRVDGEARLGLRRAPEAETR